MSKNSGGQVVMWYALSAPWLEKGYWIVVNNNTSLVSHAEGHFRCLCTVTFCKKLIFELVTRINTFDFMISDLPKFRGQMPPCPPVLSVLPQAKAMKSDGCRLTVKAKVISNVER